LAATEGHALVLGGQGRIPGRALRRYLLVDRLEFLAGILELPAQCPR
jgi:hypothetical protein